MNFIKVIFLSYLLINIAPFILSQYYATDEDHQRGLHNRRKRPNNNNNNNNNHGEPCVRQNINDPENSKFLGLAYVNIENTYNCGTGGHHMNTYGTPNGAGLLGGHHKPQKPHRPLLGGHGQNHDGQSDFVGSENSGGGGLFGNKPNRPFAGLVHSISSGLASGFGQNDGGEGPGVAFGGLVSSVVSNVGTLVSNNNPFQGGSNPFQSSPTSFGPPETVVQDVPNDPASVVERDKLPFFSNNLFQKPHHENDPNNNGFFFGLFDGSIINSYLANKPDHNTIYRPTTTQRPQYGIDNNFEAAQTPTQRPSSIEDIKPVHEDLITEAYSLHRPVMILRPSAYAHLRPGQYIYLNGMHDINRIDHFNPNIVVKQINKGVNKFLDLLLLL